MFETSHDSACMKRVKNKFLYRGFHSCFRHQIDIFITNWILGKISWHVCWPGQSVDTGWGIFRNRLPADLSLGGHARGAFSALYRRAPWISQPILQNHVWGWIFRSISTPGAQIVKFKKSDGRDSSPKSASERWNPSADICLFQQWLLKGWKLHGKTCEKLTPNIQTQKLFVLIWCLGNRLSGSFLELLCATCQKRPVSWPCDTLAGDCWDFPNDLQKVTSGLRKGSLGLESPPDASHIHIQGLPSRVSTNSDNRQL